MPSSTSLQDLTLTNASLAGGDVTVTGDFTWSVSTGQNVLNSELDVVGSATISGAGKKITFDKTTFEGNTEVSGSGLLETEFGGAAITNKGRFQIDPGAAVEANACCANPNKFISTGLLAVPASSGGTATLGFMGLSIGGSVIVGKGSGTLTGHGTVGAAVVNGGTVNPSTTAGVLTVNGTYTQTTSGTFATVISGTKPGTKFGQLVVRGAAKLAGTIKVTTGNFTPKKKQSFQVMKFRSHTGSFGKKSGTPKYSVTYSGSVHVRY
jgi:hypothetical protein